jgi:hypothetical protein
MPSLRAIQHRALLLVPEGAMEKRAVRCGQVTVVSRFCSHTADEGIV